MALFLNTIRRDNKVKRFIYRGSNVNTPVTLDGLTSLHILVQNGSNTEGVASLLKCGADVNIRDKLGRSPLHIAAETSNESCCVATAKMLLEAGANPNAQTRLGESVISIAATLSNWSIVSLLIEYGADINAVGQSALFDPPLNIACWLGNLKEMLMLIDKGADVNARGYEDRTPLHASVNVPTSFRSNPKYFLLINELLDRDCDINSRDASGQTPLHLACAKGSVLGVFALLRRGANIDVRDASDYTPVKLLDELCTSESDLFSIAVLLLEHVEAMRLVGLRKLSREADEVNQVLSKYVDEEIFTEIVERCREEFERMRAIRLDYYTTLDQLMTKSDHQMACHVKNEDFKEIMTPERLRDFPIFGLMLRDRFQNALVRRLYLEKAAEAFESFNLRGWHPSFAEPIFRYLEDSHLKDIIKASKL